MENLSLQHVPGMRGYVIYSLGTAPCPRGTGKYIDLGPVYMEVGDPG